MAALSSTDLSIEQVAELLAKEAHAHKQADGFADMIGKTWGGMQPWQKGLLLGTGGGALAGGLSSLGRRKEERRPFQSALTGAMAGGLLGGGLGLAGQNMPKSITDPVSDAYESGKDYLSGLGKDQTMPSRELLRPKKAPLTAELIGQMGPEQLKSIDLSQVPSPELMQAVMTRQKALVDQAGQAVGKPILPFGGSSGGGGGTGGVGGGPAPYDPVGPDVTGYNMGPAGSALGVGAVGAVDAAQHAYNNRIKPNTFFRPEGDALRGRDKVYADLAKPPQMAADVINQLERANMQRRRPPVAVPGVHPNSAVPRAGAWLQDKILGPDLRTPFKNPQNEQVRLMMQEGRTSRIQNRGPARRGAMRAGGYGAGLVVPALLQWLSNWQQSGRAKHDMRQQLSVGE